MRSPAQVGIVGCGVISRAYAANEAAFDTFDIVACADLDAARTAAISADFGLQALGVEELLCSDAIDVVLNLTPPSAHASVTRAALGQASTCTRRSPSRRRSRRPRRRRSSPSRPASVSDALRTSS